MVNTGTAIAIIIAFIVSYTICQNSLAGVQGAWFSELFAAKTRTTGASLAYQLSAVVSGFTPLSPPRCSRASAGSARPCCSAPTACSA